MDFNWENIKKSLREGAQMSMEKIEEYTKLGKMKIEEMAAKRKIERNFADIGERVYELAKEGKDGEVASDLVVKSAVENIDALKDEVVALQEKIRVVQEESKKEEGGPDGEEADISGV